MNYYAHVVRCMPKEPGCFNMIRRPVLCCRGERPVKPWTFTALHFSSGQFQPNPKPRKDARPICPFFWDDRDLFPGKDPLMIVSIPVEKVLLSFCSSCIHGGLCWKKGILDMLPRESSSHIKRKAASPICPFYWEDRDMSPGLTVSRQGSTSDCEHRS